MNMFRAITERYRFARFATIHQRSPAAIAAWQETHVRALIRDASTGVPLWKRLLFERGIDPRDIRTTADLARLPVTSKQTFIGRESEEYTDTSKMRGTFWFMTSGTSGTPLTFLSTERAYVAKYVNAATLRFLWWRGEWNRDLAKVKIARIKVRAQASEYRYFISVKEFLEDPSEATRGLAAFGPEIITSYPSLLLELARTVAKNPNLPNPKPRFAVSFGEMLESGARRFIEETLQCEVYDRYGLEEIGVIGHECSVHDGFHINCESVIVEVTDDAYAPLPSGETGRILVTDLFNTAMPFIRYDTGDRGRITHEPCACGLSAPRVWVEGRYAGHLRFPHRNVHHLELDAAMDVFMNEVLQYQIAKKSDHSVVVRVIPGPSCDADAKRAIETRIAETIGRNVSVSVEEVGAITLTPRGKSRIVVDESA